MITSLQDSSLQWHFYMEDKRHIYFLSPFLFEAIVADQTPEVSLHYVYDYELKCSLQALLDADTVEKAKESIVEGNLLTVLDLAGTLAMPIEKLDGVKKMVAAVSRWFVLGRCKPALESFRDDVS